MSAGEEAVTMSSAQNWHKWLVLSLFGLALSARSIGCDYSSITEKFGADAVARCNEKCPFQNRTGDGHFDVNCGSECSLQQCKLGCSLWQQALEQSCQTVCNVTSDTVLSRELYCVIGCNEALNTYFQNLRDVVGTPSAPALVADSLTATSLSLTWEPRNLINMSYLVQWKYEELPSTWQYYSNTSHSDGSIIHVENLQPYTKYRFRVAIFLSGRSNGEPIYSEPSVVISTSESGKPTSAPLALRAAAPDSSRVAISWEPGAFANGPLISYVLRLTDTQPNTIDALEDMPASNNTLFYMFQNLAAAREYEVSVTMRNAVGEGPRAVVRVSTPPLPKSTLSQQPVLILGGEHNILAAPANDMLSDPIELYSTEHVITGVGIDIQSDSLFVSVSNGFVHRSSLTKKSVSEPIVDTKIRNTQEPYNYKPLDLSVDWLNRHIYVLGEVFYTNLSNMTVFPNWEIIRYDFDGKNQIVAMSGFNLRPIHFEVDPYNGYLFYAIRSIERGGLYRLDLANISNGVRHDGQPEMIVRDPHLGAFTVDHKDFRILVAHVRRNTVLAVSLDGREVTDFRSNTQTPMFKSTRSIAYANGLFYWTNGNEMLTEEYHAQSDSYFHNEYPLAYNTKVIETRQVLVALRSCQPIPVPVNPPLLVQSVMGISRAKVSWSPPHLLGHQGSGAWQQWTFHLQLTHVETGDVIDVKDIKDFFYIVENLKSDAEYVIKVAAVTVSGSGPWSTEFIGKTLAQSPSNIHSTLLWSGPNGLLQTDLTGDNLETLIHKSLLQNFTITDISWYRDKLYLVTNESTVHWYNITSHTRGVMPNMDNVGCLAVDWVGKKIYWSNPKQQLITRGNFDGTNREPVPIVTVAKELAIDSMEAYIYWNTGHAVEAARLNGENKMVYYPAQLFSGKQVMGITVDLENKWLYWLVRSYDGSELHRAPSADVVTSGGGEVSETLISRLGGPQSLGPLVYFSGRLAWLQDAARAVLADLAGRYTAQLMPHVHGIALRDPTLHAHSESLVAIPDMINASSITIEGTWDSFNVTWAPVTNVNVNNSRVYYDVSLHFNSQNKIEKTVSVPWVVVSGGAVRAYSAVSGAVRAVTAWGAGPPAPLAARSPPAPPARPAAPRAYTACRHRCGVVSATFRWSAPLRTNGVLAGYEPQCSALARGAPRACAARPTPPSRTELVIPQLDHNATYYFRVRAFTDGGYGPFSDVISISSDEINPIPRVMLSSQEAIKIIDLDNGESETIPKTTGLPVDFAISIEENVVFWANPLEEIFSSRINVSGHYKLISNNGSAASVCVDWVARALYFSQAEGGAHALLRAALGPPPARPAPARPAPPRPAPARLFTRHHAMLSMQIAPLHGTLFWFEEGEYPGLGKIMKSNLNGTEIKTFFNNTEKFDADECNCSENPDTTKSFVVDMTNDDDYELYWIDPWMHRIVASDMYGCRCRTVLNATDSKKYGFPPMSITVDSKHVFWFNSTEKQIYYTDKYNQSAVERVKTTHGYKIMALDPAGQKYPPQHCLYPEVQSLVPKVISNSTNSLTLQMPPVDKPYECRNLTYEMTLPEYTIYYRVDTPNDTSLCDKVTCQFITSTNTEVTLMDLKPFTNYTVMLEATNYYAKLHEMRPIAGALSVLQTAAEAPSAPKNVRTTALTPELALVEWTPVPGVKYEVHWRTDDLHTTASPKLKEHNTMEAGGAGAARLPRLSAGTPYVVWVVARGPHSARAAASPPARLATPPRPPPPAAPAPAPTRLALAWPAPRPTHQYGVEYTEATVPLGEWKSCEEVKRDEWEARDLKPKTKYRFRLRLQYVDQAPIYYWPPDDRFTYETLGCAPGRPGRVRAEDVGSHMVRAWWAEPEARGAPVTHYRLWGRPLHRVVDNNENTTKNIDELLPPNLPDDLDDETKQLIVREGLELLHNGTEPYWLVSAEQLAGAGGYWAGVQARNAYGWGGLSPRAALARAAPPPRPPPLLALAAALALLLALALAIILAYNSRNKKKKKAVDNRVPSNVPRRGPDVELATLRQLPPVRHSTNILYNQGVHCPSDAEISNLPHIRREQITLTKFLGSGAFGEVFEGIARQINGATTDTKVAVKTLRKGATEQEKSEFLKEAALMSNFKHDNILRLLGVCLDNDPNYIIMELMEGGDLLSYLRAKRASLYSGGALSLLDLLSMCVDVTTGCRYLEELHFVHRDLAARNCLVATRRRGRVVKIGDFGLARDIYNNDYYRKEGEGLLPVRWMAVECLVDGVFSCQSDVWAWAVLCWEILSLGQQPYPARTNRQVLSYVRSGGKPDRPPNCPSVFYDLLQKCWSYNAEARPSFRHCLEVVTELRDKTSPNITLTATAVPTPHYLTLLGDGVSPTNDTSYRAWAACDAVDNRSYLLDENGNARLDEDGPASEMEPSRTLSARSEYVGRVRDGYEVPRRCSSLRARRPNATIVPLRAGPMRSSLCEPRVVPAPPLVDLDLDLSHHVFNTPF